MKIQVSYGYPPYFKISVEILEWKWYPQLWIKFLEFQVPEFEWENGLPDSGYFRENFENLYREYTLVIIFVIFPLKWKFLGIHPSHNFRFQFSESE